MIKPNKKIFLIIAALSPGGAERVMSALANTFVSYPDVEIHLVLLAEQEDFYEIDNRIKIHRLGFHNKGKIQKLLEVKNTFFSLRSLLKTERPDAILSFLIKYNIFTLFSTRGLGLNVYVSERNNPYRNYGKKLMYLEKITYKWAKGIVAQTQIAKTILEKRTGNKNIKVIPNPVKNIQLYPEQKRENIILNIGSLHPQKGQQYLIKAFAGINAPDWKLVILGEGKERYVLEKLIKNLKIEDKVILPGVQDNIDIWLAKASIFAFSSIYEGFPNALVEAMAAGLPVVSFDCSTGPRDIIKNNVNGVLIPTKDEKSLTQALKNLIQNKELREMLGKNALKLREELSVDKIAKQYFNFITTKL